jgi:hypothetical protein
MFSYHPFYFDFHSAHVIFDVSSGFYFWNVNRTPTWYLSKMFKVAFKDVSTKNSEPTCTYWTILFVMIKFTSFIKQLEKNPEGLYKIELCRNRHISVSSFVYKYDQWPLDSHMTGRTGVWEADDIVQFYIALLDFFPATL